MKPYYKDYFVEIYLGDSMEIVPQLEGVFDVVLLDPPYGRVRGEFDFEWQRRGDLLTDAIGWRELVLGKMKSNATLWWFAWPSLAGRLEAMIAERMTPLAHVVWKRPSPQTKKTGQRICALPLRSWSEY